MSRFRELFEAEVALLGLTWCRDCDRFDGHKRGFVSYDDRNTVHLDSEIATRHSLYGALHEVGHTQDPCFTKTRSWEAELFAEKYARASMRRLGVAIPRKSIQQGDAYIAHKKRWGREVAAGMKGKS